MPDFISIVKAKGVAVVPSVLFPIVQFKPVALDSVSTVFFVTSFFCDMVTHNALGANVVSEEAKVKLLSVLFVTLTSVNATSKPLVVLPMEKSPGPVMVSLVIEMGRVVGTVAEIFIVAVTSTELVPVAAVLLSPVSFCQLPRTPELRIAPLALLPRKHQRCPFSNS